MSLEAIVFLAVGAVVGHLVYRREGIGAAITAAVAVAGLLHVLSGGIPTSAPQPPPAPENSQSTSVQVPGG
ncbi:hypothetical protein [Streptomyces poriticola]|uniref:hypothetical protein n=1 Tax=Streptomyces poriticola TaxID=3120506 RepID=UPI002FCE45F0